MMFITSTLTPPFKFVPKGIASIIPSNVPVPVVMELKYLSTFVAAEGPPEKCSRAYSGNFHFGPRVGGVQVSVQLEEVIGERSTLSIDNAVQPHWRHDNKEQGTFAVAYGDRHYHLQAFRRPDQPDTLRYYADYALESSIDGHRVLIYDLGATGDFTYPVRDFRPEYLVFYRHPRIEEQLTAIQAQLALGTSLDQAAAPVFEEFEKEAAVNAGTLRHFYEQFEAQIRAGKSTGNLMDSLVQDISREVLRNQPPRRDLLRQCLSANALFRGLRVIVDLDGNGTFEEHESLDADVPFTIGTNTYTLKSVSADGGAVDFMVEQNQPGKVPEPRPPKQGEIPPPLRGTVVLGDGAKKTVTLAPGSPDFKGKVVLVDFWGTWCMPCRGAMPAVETLRTTMQKEFGKDQFEVLGIVSRDEKTSVPQIDLTLRLWEMKEHSYTWPQIHDADTTINTAWGVGSYPSGFLIDGDSGVVLLDQVDPREPETLNRVRELLDAKSGKH